jgi:hypothetical protein
MTALWYNLASTWAILPPVTQLRCCKTIESCDIALDYDAKAEDFKVGHSILSKKAEALLLTGDKA